MPKCWASGSSSLRKKRFTNASLTTATGAVVSLSAVVKARAQPVHVAADQRLHVCVQRGDGPALAENDVVDVLLEVWLRAIYGAAPTD